jgi:hypothetical protein
MPTRVLSNILFTEALEDVIARERCPKVFQQPGIIDDEAEVLFRRGLI